MLLFSFTGAHVNTKDGDLWSPLHFAAWQGNLNAAKQLLEKGEFTFISE